MNKNIWENPETNPNQSHFLQQDNGLSAPQAPSFAMADGTTPPFGGIKNGFGALPIQRVDKKQATIILQKAYEGGINFYDTARAYSDSEEKLGEALSAFRPHITLASKTMARTTAMFWDDLTTSLRLLRTDTIDVYQFHNLPFCPKPGDESGLYDAMLQAKQQGKIRFIGFTNHRLQVAHEAVESGLYDTLQFPFSYLAGRQETELVNKCAQHNMGFIAMKALSGGLITNAAAASAWLAQFPGVLPIWGIQSEKELDEFLSFQKNPPTLTPENKAQIEKDRTELAGDFCRGCGYCKPCPAGIEIESCARMSLFLRRSPPKQWLTEKWQTNMNKIKDCIHCGQCAARCPYGLDTPALLQKNLADYLAFNLK